MQRRTGVIGAVLALLAVVALSGAPAGGQAPEGGRSISGTIRGIDGRFVNAQISLSLRDRDDRPIDINGRRLPRAEYAALVSMNPHAPVDGLVAGGEDTWEFRGLPANAAEFTLEVYPRAAGSGAGNFTHYGGAVKRNLRLPPGGLRNVRIRFPLNCRTVPGGTTGSIRVRRFHNGQPVGNLSKFVATGADFPPFGIHGFRDQRVIPPGNAAPEFDAIAGNHRYGVEIFTPGNRWTFFEVPVRPCRRTDVIISTGRPSRVPPRFTTLPIGANAPGFPVPGDYDGDGDDDIYFYTPGGGQLWRSDGSGNRFTKSPLVASGNHRLAAGDFDADGVDEIFFYGPGTRPDRLWDFAPGGGRQVVSVRANMGGSSTYPVVGDFDDNNREDLLFVSPNAASTMRRFTAAGHTDTRINLPRGFTVRAGDVDGDWQADLILYRPRSGFGEVTTLFTRPNATSFRSLTYRVGGTRFQPIVGDYSGDFKADVIWYQPGGDRDVLWRGYSPERPYWQREDRDLRITGRFLPVSGDWNGDGTDDVLFYGPGRAADRIWRSNSPAWRPAQRWPA